MNTNQAVGRRLKKILAKVSILTACMLLPVAALLIRPSHAHTSDTSSEPITIVVPRGGIGQIDTSQLIDTTNVQSLAASLTKPPTEGVVKVDNVNTSLTYRHGGASTETDSFEFEIVDQTSGTVHPYTAIVKIRELSASIEIDFPKVAGSVPRGLLTIRYRISGEDIDHIHFQIDDGPEHSVSEPTGEFNIRIDVPGKHVLRAELANAFHQTLPISSSHKEIEFIVE